MTRKVKEEPVFKKDEPRIEVEQQAGVKPLKAVHMIVYGNDQTAPPDSVFTPITEDERRFLVDCGAAVELSKTEARLFKLGIDPDDDDDEPGPTPSDDPLN